MLMINNIWVLIVVSVLLIRTYLIYFDESSLIKFMIELKKGLFLNLFYSINEGRDVIRCLFDKWSIYWWDEMRWDTQKKKEEE